MPVVKRANVLWLLLSLVLSAVIWIVVSGQQNPYREETIQNVVVEAENLPQGLVVKSSKPVVSVRLSAPVEVWKELTASTIRATVDGSWARSGYQDLPVSVTANNWRVRVLTWQPAFVSLDVEASAKREIEVRVNSVGEVPFGYVSRPTSVSPQRLTVSGPESLVSRIAEAVVDIRLQEARTPISRQFTPLLVDSAGNEVKGVTVVPQVVQVDVPIQQQVAYKTVPVTPSIAGTVALGYRIVGIVVDPTAVTLVGDPGTLNNLLAINTVPVSVNGAVTDVTVNADLDLPPQVSMARRQGIVVRAYIEAMDGTQTLNVAPGALGLAPTLTSVFSPTVVQATVAGPMPLLSAMRAQDVRFEFDLRGLGAGTYVLTPTVTLPTPLRLIKYAPEKLTIILK